MMEMTSKRDRAFSAFDAANAKDPNVVQHRGRGIPKELLYSQLMSARLRQFAPDASEALQLAAHAQHLCRWEIPRDAYPMGRASYYAWRERLGVYHGEKAGALMKDVGYDAACIERVQALLRKENLKQDSETQCLEDVICLVFLEHYFEAFASSHPEPKVIGILKKTWAKMSDAGHEAALELNLSADTLRLVRRALG